MDRRQFISQSSLAVLAMNTPTLDDESIFCKTIFPGPLHKGDTVALISPGSHIPPDKIKKAIKNIESLGLKVKKGKHLGKKYGYLGGKDEQRLEDLHQAFADSSVQGVWCARGGYGCTRLLPLIDYDHIRKNAKPFIGYSDITALHHAFLKKSKVSTYHGPVGSSDFSPFSLEYLQILFHPHPKVSLSIPTIKHLSEGKAKGVLIGGNLSLLSAMCGTKYLPSAKGKIIFLEDIEEKPYRIDRMLVQLEQAMDLKKAKGIILGQFTDCDSDSDRSLTLEETLSNHFKDIGIPVIKGAPIGHISDQWTLPIGRKVHIDTSQSSIKLV